MQQLPQELIEKALALTGKNILDFQEPEFIHRTEGFPNIYNGGLNWFFSIEKFCFYLLSPEFIEKYTWIGIDKPMSEFHIKKQEYEICIEIGASITTYQQGNSQPLIDLLSKI